MGADSLLIPLLYHAFPGEYEFYFVFIPEFLYNLLIAFDHLIEYVVHILFYDLIEFNKFIVHILFNIVSSFNIYIGRRREYPIVISILRTEHIFTNNK